MTEECYQAYQAYLPQFQHGGGIAGCSLGTTNSRVIGDVGPHIPDSPGISRNAVDGEVFCRSLLNDFLPVGIAPPVWRHMGTAVPWVVMPALGLLPELLREAFDMVWLGPQ